MASKYGRNNENEKREYFDQDDALKSKIETLSQWMSESKHCIIFTGAGISTSTGIPDFRSGMNTVLKTGPGAWELRDTGKQRSKDAQVKSVLQALPSPTHMAIVELERLDIVKFVVSQNVDGLHLRSGLRPNALAELHGNTNLETCEQCDKHYLRDFGTRNARSVQDHNTGRLCDDTNCKGKLNDSIVNFGESLPRKAINDSFSHGSKADLCICLGSSLTVSPANEIPEMVARNSKRLVIINLQRTPLSDVASMNIHAMCDDVMHGAMKKMDIKIPRWKLERKVVITISVSLDRNKLQMRAEANSQHPDSGLPYLIFKSATMSLIGQERIQQTITKSPFKFCLDTDQPTTKLNQMKLNFKFDFFGHYGEPSCDIEQDVTVSNVLVKSEVLLFYCPYERKWTKKKLSASAL